MYGNCSDAACVTTTGAASQLISTALNFLAATQCLVSNRESPYDKVPALDTYDFIVVGAGSAGSVVASRLSEISGWSVLLLEAGSDPPTEAAIPRIYRTLSKTKYDWHYMTKDDGIRQQALKNGGVPWLRGKMLGGTSSINAMLYVRGNEHDFQFWEDGGNPSWTKENVYHYFKKAENFQDMKLNRIPSIYNTYGHDGPLVVNSYNSTDREVNKKVLESFGYIGLKEVNDINVAKFEGRGVCGLARVTARIGVRESTYKAYLKKAENRPNLEIITNAFVTKIMIDNNAKAYGVEVEIKGKLKRFYVKREVILSAGAINTPQTLMLSGIGPREHLLSKNISCIVDLPAVGENLQDHLTIPVPFYGNEPGEIDTAEQMFDVAKYLYNKKGYLSHVFLSEAIAFFSRNKHMEYPEFQSHFVVYRKNTTVRQFIDIYKDEVLDSLTRYNQHKSLYLYFFNLLHPESKGKISLKSANPHDYPIIDANYLGDDRDIEATVAGIKILSKLVDTPYFKSIEAFMPRVDLPQCNKYKFRSDLYWKCYALQMCSTMSHPVGTAKMGPDPGDSAVNNLLKVHGVCGLRVIDASIMPGETSGNTNAPTIMIAELASDMIKDEYLGLEKDKEDNFDYGWMDY